MSGLMALSGNAISNLNPVPLQQMNTALTGYATKADPIFSGDPKSVTPAPGDNDTSIATTAWVNTAIAAHAAAVVPYASLPTEVQQVPLAFFAPGKPATAASYYLAMPWALTIPANLAGSVVYYGTQATTADASFNLFRIRAGAALAFGSILMKSTPASNTLCVLSGAGGSLVAGDVLQLVAPNPQNAALSDIGITILASRV
jgi:hypothetical protein